MSSWVHQKVVIATVNSLLPPHSLSSTSFPINFLYSVQSELYSDYILHEVRMRSMTYTIFHWTCWSGDVSSRRPPDLTSCSIRIPVLGCNISFFLTVLAMALAAGICSPTSSTSPKEMVDSTCHPSPLSTSGSRSQGNASFSHQLTPASVGQQRRASSLRSLPSGRNSVLALWRTHPARGKLY